MNIFVVCNSYGTAVKQKIGTAYAAVPIEYALAGQATT